MLHLVKVHVCTEIVTVENSELTATLLELGIKMADVAKNYATKWRAVMLGKVWEYKLSLNYGINEPPFLDRY